ncbi:MAG: transposase [Opitutaceae bacterium]
MATFTIKPFMARKLRIQYEGALYHIINRGNYRRDLFETVGAAQSFLAALFEATRRYGWRLHAFVLMRNHYHVALETPKSNLVEGMHWLQSTIATRFNRYRRERGHLFQGRYQSILVEDFAALARVVDYIHLNPVRAKIVPPEQVMNYRWSSLPRFVRGPREAGIVAADWLRARGEWSDNREGWAAYKRHLTALALDEAEQKRQGLEGLSSGWAIGTAGWQRAIAKEYSHLRLTGGLERAQAKALNEGSWEARLLELLGDLRKTPAQLITRPKKLMWKLELARRLRQEAGASVVWVARTLHLGRPASVRSYLVRGKLQNNQQTAA